MDPRSQLRHNLRADNVSDQDQATVQNQGALEFASPEELLRHDRTQTAVPGAIAARLESSLRLEPAPRSVRPWWRRWLG